MPLYPVVITEALGILLPAIAAAAVGYVDDKRGLFPSVRLALQAVIGLAIAFALRDTVNITVEVGLVTGVITPITPLGSRTRVDVRPST